MDLYLVRHGQSIGNTTREIVSGKSDTQGLTLKGKNQILRSAWELRDKEITSVYTSPVFRAKETASIISQTLSIPLHEALFLSEWDYGIIEGKKWNEVYDLLPEAFRSHRKEDFITPYEGGESLEMVARRVWGGFRAFVEGNNYDGSYVLVSHMVIICTILFGIQIDIPVLCGDEYVSYIHSTGVPNGSITHLSVEPNIQTILSVSRRFPPLDHSEEVITQYAQIHLKKNSLKASYKQTASITNEVYLLENGEKAVCKVMYDQEPVRADRLAELYQYLQDHTDVPSPRLIHSDISYVFLNHPVLIQDYVEGQEQTACLSRPHCMKKVFMELLSILDRLHAIPSVDVRAFWMPDDWYESGIRDWNRYMTDEIQKTSELLPKFNKYELNIDLVISKLSIISSHIKFREDLFVPIHGDLAPTNIIVSLDDEYRLIRLLDFERAQIADPLWEYVYYYGWLQRETVAAAATWHDIIFRRLSQEERELFDLYVILFHAWTVRDQVTYEGNVLRESLGVQSLRILEEICH